MLYVDQRSGYKNLVLLLRALQVSAELRSLPLVLAGGGRLNTTERTQIDDIAGRRKVTHYGAVDETTLIDL